MHERLYREHFDMQRRRSTAYDPSKKDREEEVLMCTFKPSLQKSMSNGYLKTGSMD